MDAKKNPGGLAWLTTDPRKFAAFMADRSPTFKAFIARMINASRTPVAGGIEGIGSARQAAGSAAAQAPVTARVAQGVQNQQEGE
jgi:hypothetical protein